MQEYTISRKCDSCGNIDSYNVSKEEAAFLRNSDYWNKPCSKCGSIKCGSLSYPTAEIDDELMDIWSKDATLFFLDQDEELILSEVEYVDLIFRFIDSDTILSRKRGILIEALLVLIYDIITDEDEIDKIKISSLRKIKEFLLLRKQYIHDYDYLIRDYIKEVVYPELGMEFEMMKVKVCGMKNPENIGELAKLPIDYMGLIFYPKSPRYIAELNPQLLDILPSTIERVGVFVNEDINVVLKQIKKYSLILVQLHGQESPQYCQECYNLSNAGIIKAFNIASADDFEQTEPYEDTCNYFLYDTKTSQHGGSGQKFDWNILEAYKGNTPFFLSGGISPDDIEAIKKIQHPKLYGIDINSRFEIEPALKDIELIDKFIKEIKL